MPTQYKCKPPRVRTGRNGRCLIPCRLLQNTRTACRLRGRKHPPVAQKYWTKGERAKGKATGRPKRTLAH